MVDWHRRGARIICQPSECPVNSSWPPLAPLTSLPSCGRLSTVDLGVRRPTRTSSFVLLPMRGLNPVDRTWPTHRATFTRERANSWPVGRQRSIWRQKLMLARSEDMKSEIQSSVHLCSIQSPLDDSQMLVTVTRPISVHRCLFAKNAHRCEAKIDRRRPTSMTLDRRADSCHCHRRTFSDGQLEEERGGKGREVATATYAAPAVALVQRWRP